MSDELQHRRDIEALGGARPERAPTLVRVRRGIWTETPAATPDDAYRQLVRAAHRTLTGAHVFSHESAAVLHGLPALRGWPTTVHLLCERGSGGRSQLDVVRHCLGLEGVELWARDDMVLTGPARTAFDIALSRPFDEAVAVADALLRRDPAAEEELRCLLDRWDRRRGWRRAAAVIDFADGRAETPGESLSRVSIDRLGFVRPELQVPVVTDGQTDYGDFGWEEVGGIGEFDGEQKYRLDRYRRGGSIADVVVREKNRENRMRLQRPRFARWDWTDLHQDRLERILLAAGIPKRRY